MHITDCLSYIFWIQVPAFYQTKNERNCLVDSSWNTLHSNKNLKKEKKSTLAKAKGRLQKKACVARGRCVRFVSITWLSYSMCECKEPSFIILTYLLYFLLPVVGIICQELKHFARDFINSDFGEQTCGFTVLVEGPLMIAVGPLQWSVLSFSLIVMHNSSHDMAFKGI